MEQLCSHCLDFHEIKYLSIFQKSVEKIQVSLQLDKKSGYLTWKPVHILIIFCSVYRRMMFQAKVVEKIKTHFMLNNFFFFFKNRTSYDLMWKNVVELDMPQMTIWHVRLHAGYVRLQTHAQNI